MKNINTCLGFAILLEGCVGDGELVLCAELEQEAPVVVTVTNAVSSKDSFPGLGIPPNSSVEVAKDEDLVVFRGVVQESAQMGLWVYYRSTPLLGERPSMADEPHPPGASLVILRQAPAVALSLWLESRGYRVEVGVGLRVCVTRWMF